MSTGLTDRPANGYDEETFNLILTVLATHGGNARRACKRLKEDHKLDIPRRTVQRWTTCDRYKTIRAELAPKLQEDAAQRYEDVASTLLAAQHEMADSLLHAAANDQFDKDDLPKALKFVADAAQTNTSQALLLRGRPTQITEHRDADSLIRKLRAAGIVDVESTELPRPLATSAHADPHASKQLEAGTSD